MIHKEKKLRIFGRVNHFKKKRIITTNKSFNIEQYKHSTSKVYLPGDVPTKDQSKNKITWEIIQKCKAYKCAPIKS